MKVSRTSTVKNVVLRLTAVRRIAFCVCLLAPSLCIGQAAGEPVKSSSGPSPTPPPVVAQQEPSPLTEREKAMMELIKQLQDRVTKLESQVPTPGGAAPAAPLPDVPTDSETGAPKIEPKSSAADQVESEVGAATHLISDLNLRKQSTAI